MKLIPLSHAKFEWLSGLLKAGEAVTLTMEKRPVAVVLSIDDFEAMTAMVTLGHDPERLKEVLDDHNRVQRGDISDFIDLKDALELIHNG